MKLNVRTKLLGGFIAVIALMALIGAISLVKLSSVRGDTRQIGRNTLPTMVAIGDMNAVANRYRKDQFSYVSTAALNAKDSAAVQAALDALKADDSQLRADLVAKERLATDAQTHANDAALQREWQAYLYASSPIEQMVANKDYTGALRLLTSGAANDAFDPVKTRLTSMTTHQNALAGQRVTDAAGTVSSASKLIVVVLVIGMLVGISLALLIARKIAGGLRQMLAAARGIAEGDVEQQVELTSGDELGQTAEAFRAMIAYLEEMAQAARRIAAGDLAVDVQPKSEHDALGNAFAAMSVQLRDALGDRSCLEQLVERMESLSDTCLADLEAALAAVGSGDLTRDAVLVTTPIEAQEDRAVGRLAAIFNRMLKRVDASIGGYNQMREQVAGMLRRIAAESQAVASASQQMATTSEESGRAVGEIAAAVGEVAAGAERQVRTVAETRELTDEVVRVTNDSAEHARQTALAAEQARAVAEEGATTIAHATAAMGAVQEMSVSITGAMRGLGAKSEQIGGIVDTITGIAEQTNLLALNAAIEAARAGDQGRGFAVVAEEVRKLAEESQQAAASISTLVEEIQRETGNAVANVESGGARIDESATTVHAAREAFERIGTSVQDMTSRVEQIATAAAHVSQSATQMGEQMAEVVSVAEQSSASTEQVSASTQQTSASTQEIAASAQGLAATAEEMARLVSRFKLAHAE